MMQYSDPESILRSVEHCKKAIDDATSAGDSDIQKFYCGSSVFITGATGFLGKQLVEKLLRSTDVGKMFLLIRSKKGLSNVERLQLILKDPLFDTLRIEKPDFSSRIVCVDGDISYLGLGINIEDWNTITEEVDIIFHCAATTKFDEDLRVATFINLRGTKEALLLGKACKKLRSFVHVSTAFSHATKSRISEPILEKFYPAPVDPQLFLDMAEKIGDKFYDATNGLLQDWPNSYAFTKALAEELVRLEGTSLPICIVRPPYVMSTYHEPAPGWVDTSCVYGPSGMIIGIGLGVVHVSLNKDIKLALTPCDYVNNAIITAAWDVGARQQDGENEIDIYNVANIKYNNSWGTLRKHIESEEIRKLNTSKCVWYAYMVETGSPFMYLVLTWLLHYIPAYIADGIYSITGIKKPRKITSFVKLYKKLYTFGLTFQYFFSNEWYFDDTKLQKLITKMSDQDKIIYNFNIRDIDWHQLLLIWIIGLRKYVIKDDLKDNSGYEKQKYFKIIHWVFFSVYILICMFSFYFIYKSIYSCFLIYTI